MEEQNLGNPQDPQLNTGVVVCSVCGLEKEKDKDCDYCIRQYALSWGL
jgi:hypothetical protein